MKKKFPLWLTGLLAAIVTVAAGYLWYTRPMTLEQLCPAFDWDEVVGVQGHYIFSVGQDILQTNYIKADQPDIQALIQNLRGATARRCMSRNTFRGITDGPLNVSIYLRSGQNLFNLNLYGDFLTISLSGPDGFDRRQVCTLTDQSPDWHAWVDFIDAHPRQ